MAATFSTTGGTVFINNVAQVSSVTQNDYLARYGNPSTGYTKPFIISVVANDGSRKDYTLIANPNLIDFRAGGFLLNYTSDTTNVKFYQSRDCKIAIDPVTQKLTTYTSNGAKFLSVNTPTSQNVAFYDNNYGRLHGVGVTNDIAYNFDTSTQWGAAVEFVLYGCDFFLQDNGRSDLMVLFGDGYYRGVVCDTWGDRICTSMTRFF